MVRQNGSAAPVILNSWKEIAAYLDRGVRTVQRWERELVLPVHRIGKGKRSPVYADVKELKFWLATSGAGQHQPNGSKQLGVSHSESKPVENVHRLLLSVRTLAQQIAETSVRQQRQAEVLRDRILEMRGRIK